MKPNSRTGRIPGAKNKTPAKILKWGQRWNDQATIAIIQATADMLGRNPGSLMQEATMKFCKQNATIKKCVCAVTGDPKCCRDCKADCQHRHMGECIWES